MKIRTPRLILVAGTPELTGSELADRAAFFALLGVPAPDLWPPEENDETTMRYFLDGVSRGPEQAGWWCWYVLFSAPDGPRLAGSAGFKGPPSASGEVEIGYSILPSWRNRGIAKEAVAGLCRWAESDPRISRIVAETLPHLDWSIRVLRACGFEGPLSGSEDGVIRFLRPRPSRTGTDPAHSGRG
jgi:ribosomal-protein-alanine N-acetyltransferase